MFYLIVSTQKNAMNILKVTQRISDRIIFYSKEKFLLEFYCLFVTLKFNDAVEIPRFLILLIYEYIYLKLFIHL